MEDLDNGLDLRGYKPLHYPGYADSVKEGLMSQEEMDLRVGMEESYRKISLHIINTCIEVCAGKDAAVQTRILEAMKVELSQT